MSVSDPFTPDDLAGQIKYLIDNQDVYLVDRLAQTSPTALTVRLWTGEWFVITVQPAPAPGAGS